MLLFIKLLYMKVVTYWELFDTLLELQHDNKLLEQLASWQQAVDNLSTSWKQPVRTQTDDKLLEQHCYKSAAVCYNLCVFTCEVDLAPYTNIFFRKIHLLLESVVRLEVMLAMQYFFKIFLLSHNFVCCSLCMNFTAKSPEMAIGQTSKIPKFPGSISGLP
jgi:hypothetical protein